MNPYLYPQGAGGGWMPPAGAYFGAAPGSGVFTPSPGAYFGRAAMAAQAPCPPTQVQPVPCGHGQGGLDPTRLQQLNDMLRHPLGQWPGMPPLTHGAVQDAASCVTCHSQTHADDLSTIYGVDSGGVALIAAAAAATITVTPQKRHIPERIVLSTPMAAAFIISGIFAGVEPVLATTGPISAAIFVQDSTSGNFKSVIMDVGMDFSIGVINISGAPARFTATVRGKPVPPGLV